MKRRMSLNLMKNDRDVGWNESAEVEDKIRLRIDVDKIPVNNEMEDSIVLIGRYGHFYSSLPCASTCF